MSCAENLDRLLCRRELLTPWLSLPYAHRTFPYAGCFEVSQLRRLRRLRFSMKPSWRLRFGLRGLRGLSGPPSWAHLPLHVHTFPSWAHLPLHGHIFRFMGTYSPSWAHLPLHGLSLRGHIFLFTGTSSPHLPLPQTWSQVHSVGFALRIAYAELTRGLRKFPTMVFL